MTYIDAVLAQQILYIPEREREPDVHNHRNADDFRRRLEVTEGAAFFHDLRLSRHPDRLKSV